MLYQIQDGSMSFGERVILSHTDMEIKGKEKIGIVGQNGAGKTSLLKLIAGELELDRDDRRKGKGITSSRKLRIGKMDQDPQKWMENSIEEILLKGFYEKEETTKQAVEVDYSAERFYYEQKYDRMLQDFGFKVEDKNRKLKEFSGGEQTKVMLVKLLLTEADIILLDEPTNHLDEQSVEALEEYVKEYNAAVVAVSHDRYFLDQVAECIYELEDAQLTRYDGNYTAYRAEKRKRREKQKAAYERQQEEIARNEELIKQFKNKPKKAAFARSRKTLLDRMERIEKPKDDVGHIFTGELKPEYPGPKWMLQMEKLQIGFKGKGSLLGELDLRVKRGTKIGIIGRNGIGKSTLLKTLTGTLTPLKGSYQFGEKVTIGYFDQTSGQMGTEEKVVDHFKKLFPGMLEKEVYGKLASFLFRGSVCQSKINTLSGGEKSRLRLCELMTLCPNFMILDEPTNHMDIPAKETLESAFRAYTGTMLIVSHDRYFLDQVADAMLVLEEGAAYYYPFGYSHYLQSRKKMEKLLSKGVSLDDLPGMLSTQEQAMVTALKAVPKAERHESRPLSDDEAYLEWKLHLAEEPMVAAEETVQEKWNRYQAAKEAVEIQLIQESESMIRLSESEEIKKKLELLEQAKEEYDSALTIWTDLLLNWYDIFNSED